MAIHIMRQLKEGECDVPECTHIEAFKRRAGLD